MRKITLGVVAVAAVLLLAGCKKVYMVPTPKGWMEMQTSKDENKIKIKPAEKVKVKYDY